MPHPLITLTTDFGEGSPYVAQMKGAILTINPNVTIVDVTHSIPPQSIRQGALVLSEIWRSFRRGTIHVAVVDPGVGTEREILCALCDGHFFVLPNNGLLTEVAESAPPVEIRALINRQWWREPVSDTFHGRDMMAPVAAHLSLGVSLEALGPPRSDYQRLELPRPCVHGQQVAGEIIRIDAFGNLISNIPRSLLEAATLGELRMTCAGHQIRGLSTTYGQHSSGTLIALFGSSGRLEIAVVNGSAAARLNARLGAPVEVVLT